MRTRVRKPGFSLTELVIVVVIIGIIAAIAAPRLAEGGAAAADAALRGSLRTLRGAIDMYAGEHDNVWPASKPADRSEATFIDQLTKKTNSAGAVGNAPGEHIFGPYLRGIPPVPVGPNVGARGIDLKTTGFVYEAVLSAGWVYNYDTGEIYANTDDLGQDGVGYNTY
ncbi:MAG: prepilin-type N-terminal cleavage/methylation domain-containing protein [Phycisphaerales bacterium]|nr:MAG: prepilin-type N-terminal cleavage/methylation domain-containing protein [Phycisphaerales bacterium]